MRASRTLRPVVSLCLLAGASFASADGQAKVMTESPYSRAQTYSAAVRFIRVDRGFEIFEQDRETGYVLFKYRSDDHVSNGSIEVLQVGEHVKVVVQLPRMPEYHEQVLTDGLQRKLREEYGEPPRREPSKPKEKKPKSDVIRRPDERSPAENERGEDPKSAASSAGAEHR